MNRVTKAMLETLADTINNETGSPLKPWVWKSVRYPTFHEKITTHKASIGNYHISYAYSGACLHRMSNESGGVSCPIINHHVPKRELWNLMWAYLQGLRISLTHTTEVNNE